jgi:hypothetical protein
MESKKMNTAKRYYIFAWKRMCYLVIDVYNAPKLISYACFGEI